MRRLIRSVIGTDGSDTTVDRFATVDRKGGLEVGCSSDHTLAIKSWALTRPVRSLNHVRWRLKKRR